MSQRAGLRVLLRERDFRFLLSAQFLAQAADGFAQAAFAEELVLEPFSQGAPGRILSVFALTLIPYSIIAPFLGVFVDRWRRRSLLFWTNVLRAIVLMSLPFWSGLFAGDTALYAGVLILLAFGRLFLTTKGALLPAVLHEHHLLRGNAVSGGGGMIAALFGGVVGVGAVGKFGPEPAFAMAGIVYGIAAMAASKLSKPYDHPHARSESFVRAVARVSGELVEGFSAITARSRAYLPLIGIFLLRTAGILVAIGAILVIKKEFPESDDRAGRLGAAAFALGAAGVGAFLGAVSAPRLGRRFSVPQLIVVGYVVSAVGILVLGGVAEISAVLGLTFMGGLGGFITKVAVDAQLQEALPDEYRGRAFALYDILYNLASVAAAVVMLAFEETALRTLLLWSGVATLFVAALLSWAMGRAGMLRNEPEGVEL